jgi:cell pole-organizing protein PopZ
MSTDAVRTDETKPAAGERSSDPLGSTVPGHKAELETPPDRSAAQSVDAALSEAQKKVERHFGSLPEPAERPAPLGLRSIRDPLRDVKPAGGLMSRVAAATQAAAAEPVADKVRGANGTAGAATTSAAAMTAKQAETTPAAKTVGASTTAEAKTAGSTTASAAVQSEAAKTAAGAAKPSLEEAVAEMLRPMLNTWLEANLSRIVEQVVREHVAKTPVPGKDKPTA